MMPGKASNTLTIVNKGIPVTLKILESGGRAQACPVLTGEGIMAGYVEQVIGKGEEVWYRAKISLLSYWASFVLGVLLLIGSIPAVADPAAAEMRRSMLIVLGVAILLVVWPLIVRAATELAITNRRIIAKYGVLSTRTIELNFKKIESISVQQSMFGRILGFGDVVVIGTGGTREVLKRISDPLGFRRAYDTGLAKVDNGLATA